VVANRCAAMGMKVLAFDPFISTEKAKQLGIELADLETIYKRSDFITLHTPKTKETANLVNKDTIAKMKDGVRIINCARGGIVNEQDLYEALKSGKVGGAAFDVFEKEPLPGVLDTLVLTPVELGRSLMLFPGFAFAAILYAGLGPDGVALDRALAGSYIVPQR